MQWGVFAKEEETTVMVHIVPVDEDGIQVPWHIFDESCGCLPKVNIQHGKTIVAHWEPNGEEGPAE